MRVAVAYVEQRARARDGRLLLLLASRRRLRGRTCGRRRNQLRPFALFARQAALNAGHWLVLLVLLLRMVARGRGRVLLVARCRGYLAAYGRHVSRRHLEHVGGTRLAGHARDRARVRGLSESRNEPPNNVVLAELWLGLILLHLVQLLFVFQIGHFAENDLLVD